MMYPFGVVVEPWRCFVHWPPELKGLGTVVAEIRRATGLSYSVRYDDGSAAEVDATRVGRADNVLGFGPLAPMSSSSVPGGTAA